MFGVSKRGTKVTCLVQLEYHSVVALQQISEEKYNYSEKTCFVQLVIIFYKNSLAFLKFPRSSIVKMKCKHWGRTFRGNEYDRTVHQYWEGIANFRAEIDLRADPKAR